MHLLVSPKVDVMWEGRMPLVVDSVIFIISSTVSSPPGCPLLEAIVKYGVIWMV